MKVNSGGGSPVVHPQRYQTTPLAVISQAEQQDRYCQKSELKRLASYFDSGAKLLEIVATINQNADAIVAAGAKRIFFGGNAMDYLDKPQESIDLPGYGKPVTLTQAALAKANANNNQQKISNSQLSRSLIGSSRFNLIELLSEILYRIQGVGQEPLPGGFKPINISRYGEFRMKRSMRDLDWFLRYLTFAITADNPSILAVNARGLRGVIPEDVTVATVVALKAMCWHCLSYFPEDLEAQNIVKYYFDVLIKEYEIEKPADRLREGVSNQQQGLKLPQSYWLAAESRPKLVMKSNLSAADKHLVIKAAYRQIFKCDIRSTYGITFSKLESQVMGGNISLKEFVRSLGKTKLYRRLNYEPYPISRVIELASDRFLGRGLSSIEEFRDYFELISSGGLPALIDALVDSVEYSDYFGEETVPYPRGLGQEAQECRNWGAQVDLYKFSAAVRKVPQFITLFANYQQSLPNQHPYGVGNDPLETQFGAVFPSETRDCYSQPIASSRDSQRILINSALGSNNVNNSHLLARKTLKLTPNHSHKNINLLSRSYKAIIRGAYGQIWGCQPYFGQHLTVAETQLQNGTISVQEFVRKLAKSSQFRQLYWDRLYVTKAIESIHRRLLGRPTHGRSEMNHYYDLCSKQGFYALIDEILDSNEYLDAFGEDTVPYERYLTSKGWTKRSLSQSINWTEAQLNRTASAGEVVAQKILADRQRVAHLNVDNGRAENKSVLTTKEIVLQEVIESSSNPSVADDSNLELVEQPEITSQPESYEYSQTTDS